ncbi:hypothetical protein M5G07_08750 [Serratia symbiotica]|nr:hypothetical protein [Serratia symbiotica]
MIDDAGKNLVSEMKKRPAMVDASRRKIHEALDELAVEIHKLVTVSGKPNRLALRPYS